jgi:hypothetical protein
MRIVKISLIILAMIVVVVGAIVIRLSWAASTPSLPKGLPKTAIWLPAPPTPLNFSPSGYWLACWLDHTRNVDRCKLTDYKGNSKFEEDYTAIAGLNPIPDDRLNLTKVGDSDLWAWSRQDSRGVPVAHLKDGTILVPSRDLVELRNRFSSQHQ